MCIHHFCFITFEEFYEIYERFIEEYEEKEFAEKGGEYE